MMSNIFLQPADEHLKNIELSKYKRYNISVLLVFVLYYTKLHQSIYLFSHSNSCYIVERNINLPNKYEYIRILLETIYEGC